MRLATLWLCFLPTFVMAQTITYANPAPVPQAGWMTFTLPIESAPDFGTLGGQPCYGGRTVGAARVMHALVRMDGFEHRTEEFRAAAAQPEAGRLTTPQVTPQIGNVSAEAGDNRNQAEVAGAGHVVTTHSVVRQGSFVFELWVDWFPGDSPAQWELLVSFSDPTTSAIEATLPKIELRLPAPWAAMPLWAPWRATRVEAGSTVLADGGPIRDSQGLAWRGVLVRTDTPAHGGALWGLPMGVADAATWEGHWGPFGVVPTGSPDEARYRRETTAWMQRAGSPGNLWAVPRLGMAANPAQTGGQQDFGVSKLRWAWDGGPLHLDEAMAASFQEACRPGLWYEADGSIVDPANHPNWVVWSGFTHWHPSVSSDRLGKPTTASSWIGGWRPKDREHWSTNTLAGTALLTGSHLLQRLLVREAVWVLAGETLDPRLSTSHSGAARGVGRTLLAAAWLHCALEDRTWADRVQERILARLERVIEPETRCVTGWALCPLAVVTDPRRLGGQPCQSWEEPLGLIGLRAAELRFGSQVARRVLERAGAPWISTWWQDPSKGWVMADVVAVRDGRLPGGNEFPTWAGGAWTVPVEPPVVERSASFGFEGWSPAALRAVAATAPEGQARARALVLLGSQAWDPEWAASR